MDFKNKNTKYVEMLKKLRNEKLDIIYFIIMYLDNFRKKCIKVHCNQKILVSCQKLQTTSNIQKTPVVYKKRCIKGFSNNRSTIFIIYRYLNSKYL